MSLDMDEELRLTPEDFELTKAAATRTVTVPNSVVQLLIDLRSYLQVRVRPWHSYLKQGRQRPGA